MGKTYRSDGDDYSSYGKFSDKKAKEKKIKGFLKNKADSKKYDYLNDSQSLNPKE